MSDDLSLLLRQWGSKATGHSVKSQYREDTALPLSEPPIIAAAGYLATLAYPDDWEQRDKLVLAFMAYLAKGNTATPAEWREMPARDTKRILRKAQNKIWFERFPSTQAAYELVQNRWLGTNENRVHEVCAKYAKKAGRSTSKFVEREWSQSKPVFHLVHAFASNLETKDAIDWPLGRFVSRPQWVTGAIAESHNHFMALRKKKIVKDNELILLHAQ